MVKLFTVKFESYIIFKDSQRKQQEQTIVLYRNQHAVLQC